MVYSFKYYSSAIQFILKKAFVFFKKLFSDKDYYEEEIKKENLVLTEAAKKLNIEVIDHQGGMQEFRYNKQRTFIKGNATEIESAVSHKIAGDKYLVSQLLSEKGLPVPVSRCFLSSLIEEAIEYFIQNDYPVVVKPCRGTSGGVGVTAGVDSIKDFKKAFYEASFYDQYVLIEQFIVGENIRLLILDKVFLSAVRRIPGYVVGDGKNTIKTLIKKTNHQRENSTNYPKLWPILINNDLQITLRRKNVNLRSVPPENKKIFIKTICNGHQGGIVEEVTKNTHSDYIQLCIKALEICKVKFGGVDIITNDISKPISQAGGFINEINTTPSFYGHYQAINRDEIQDVAGKFFRYIFDID